MVWKPPLQMIPQPARWLPTVGISTVRLATELYSNFVGSFDFILNIPLYFSYQITADTLLALTSVQATTDGTCMLFTVWLLLHFRFSLFYLNWDFLNRLILYIYQPQNALSNTQEIWIIKYNSWQVSNSSCFATEVPSSGSLLEERNTVQHANPGTDRPPVVLKY